MLLEHLSTNRQGGSARPGDGPAGQLFQISHAKEADFAGSLSAPLTSLLRDLPFIGTEAMGKGL
jgi:hypothetical protein